MSLNKYINWAFVAVIVLGALFWANNYFGFYEQHLEQTQAKDKIAQEQKILEEYLEKVNNLNLTDIYTIRETFSAASSGRGQSQSEHIATYSERELQGFINRLKKIDINKYSRETQDCYTTQKNMPLVCFKQGKFESLYYPGNPSSSWSTVNITENN